MNGSNDSEMASEETVVLVFSDLHESNFPLFF